MSNQYPVFVPPNSDNNGFVTEQELSVILQGFPSASDFLRELNGKLSTSGGTLSGPLKLDPDSGDAIIDADAPLDIVGLGGVTLKSGADTASGKGLSIDTAGNLNLDANLNIQTGKINALNGDFSTLTLNSIPVQKSNAAVTTPSLTVTGTTATINGNPIITSTSLSTSLASYVQSSVLSSYALISSLSGYITSTSLSSSLSAYVLNSSLSTLLSSYALSSSLSVYALSSSLSSYVTTSNLTSQLSNFVNSSSLAITLQNYATLSTLSSYQTTAGMAFYATTNMLTNAVDGLINQDGLQAVLQSYVTTISMSAYQTVANMSSYATTNSVVAQLANYTTTNAMNLLLQSYASASSLSNYVLNSSLVTTLQGYQPLFSSNSDLNLRNFTANSSLSVGPGPGFGLLTIKPGGSVSGISYSAMVLSSGTSTYPGPIFIDCNQGVNRSGVIGSPLVLTNNFGGGSSSFVTGGSYLNSDIARVLHCDGNAFVGGTISANNYTNVNISSSNSSSALTVQCPFTTLVPNATIATTNGSADNISMSMMHQGIGVGNTTAIHLGQSFTNSYNNACLQFQYMGGFNSQNNRLFLGMTTTAPPTLRQNAGLFIDGYGKVYTGNNTVDDSSGNASIVGKLTLNTLQSTGNTNSITVPNLTGVLAIQSNPVQFTTMTATTKCSVGLTSIVSTASSANQVTLPTSTGILALLSDIPTAPAVKPYFLSRLYTSSGPSISADPFRTNGLITTNSASSSKCQFTLPPGVYEMTVAVNLLLSGSGPIILTTDTTNLYPADSSGNRYYLATGTNLPAQAIPSVSFLYSCTQNSTISLDFSVPVVISGMVRINAV